MAGGTDNNKPKSAAKTRWRWQQQFVDNNKDDDGDDDDDKADTARAVGGDDNGGNSDGRGHRQQSTKIGSKDTVAVATAIR
jgi:hypothetical protein